MKMIVYMDDMCLAGPSREYMEETARYLMTTLENYGVIVNKKKSQLKPTESIEFLGRNITNHSVTNRKEAIDKMVKSYETYKNQPTVGHWLSLLGQISFL